MTAAFLVGAVVVVYGQELSELEPLVEALLRDGVHEVVLVDNGSPVAFVHGRQGDGFTYTVVSTGKNIGFGRAVNLGASYLSSFDYLVVSNPDISLTSPVISELLTVLEGSPNVAIVAPKILTESGDRYPSVRRFPSTFVSLIHGFLGLFWKGNPVSRWYRLDGLDLDRPISAPWVSGAFFVIRGSSFRLVGGFDPKYFLYCEDVDLCDRVERLKFDVVYYPKVAVMHSQGGSSAHRPVFSLYHHHRSMWLYAKSKNSFRPLLILEALGISVRFLTSLIVRKVSS